MNEKEVKGFIQFVKICEKSSDGVKIAMENFSERLQIAIAEHDAENLMGHLQLMNDLASMLNRITLEINYHTENMGVVGQTYLSALTSAASKPPARAEVTIPNGSGTTNERTPIDENPFIDWNVKDFYQLEKYNEASSLIPCNKQCQTLDDSLKMFMDRKIFDAIIAEILNKDELTFNILAVFPCLEELTENCVDLPEFKYVPRSNHVIGIQIDGGRIMRCVREDPNSLDGFLIDMGQRIKLDRKYRYYYIPEKYQNVETLVVKCRLIGTDAFKHSADPNVEYDQLIQLLEDSVNKKCRFEVKYIMDGMIFVRIIAQENESSNRGRYFKSDNSSEKMNVLETMPKNTNPFVDTFEVQSTSAKEIVRERLDAEGANIRTIKVLFIDHVEYFYADVYYDPSAKDSCWNNEEVEDRILTQPPFIDDDCLVLARFEGYWYRAKLEGYDDATQLYKVYFVDYGNVANVPMQCLASIWYENSIEPFRAKRCRVTNWCPHKYDETSLERATSILNSKLLEKCIRVEVLTESSDEMAIRIVDEHAKVYDDLEIHS